MFIKLQEYCKRHDTPPSTVKRLIENGVLRGHHEDKNTDWYVWVEDNAELAELAAQVKQLTTMMTALLKQFNTPVANNYESEVERWQ